MASAACCNTPPVVSDYTPVGTTSKLQVGADTTDVYVTGSGSQGVILITDIFGFDFKQTLQVADRLAAAGMAVAVPDVFKGKPWPKSKIPMKPEDKFMEWIGGYSWEVVSQFVNSSVELLQSQGATKFGCLGFCWGVAMAMQAGADPRFSAVGGAHPSLFGQDKELTEMVQCPVILLPAQGDPMDAVKAVTDSKPFGPKCVYQRFDDQEHGFCAARGEWSDPKVAAAATQAIELMVTFCKSNI